MKCKFTHKGREFTLTDEHPASSHGIPVLVDDQGRAFGRDDRVGDHWATVLVEHYRPTITGPDALVQRFIYY